MDRWHVAKITMDVSDIWIDQIKTKKMIVCPSRDEIPSTLDDLTKKGWERIENPSFASVETPKCLANKGDMKKSLEMFHKFLEIEPDSKDAEIIKQVIKSLPK